MARAHGCTAGGAAGAPGQVRLRGKEGGAHAEVVLHVQLQYPNVACHPNVPYMSPLPPYQQQRSLAPQHLTMSGPRCFRDWLLLCSMPCKHSNLHATCCCPTTPPLTGARTTWLPAPRPSWPRRRSGARRSCCGRALRGASRASSNQLQRSEVAVTRGTSTLLLRTLSQHGCAPGVGACWPWWGYC